MRGVRAFGVGGDGGSMVSTPFGVFQQDSELDEGTLQRIAAKTDGKYFRAKDGQSLRDIYAEIEKMEKRKIVDRHFESEPPAMPLSFLSIALLLTVVGWGIPRFLFRQND